LGKLDYSNFGRAKNLNDEHYYPRAGMASQLLYQLLLPKCPEVVPNTAIKESRNEP
jgi:hypothetical protein